MRKEIVDLRLSHAKTTARWGWIQIAATAAVGAIIVAVVKHFLGG